MNVFALKAGNTNIVPGERALRQAGKEQEVAGGTKGKKPPDGGRLSCDGGIFLSGKIFSVTNGRHKRFKRRRNAYQKKEFRAVD
jgi:hypothetical protein